MYFITIITTINIIKHEHEWKNHAKPLPMVIHWSKVLKTQNESLHGLGNLLQDPQVPICGHLFWGFIFCAASLDWFYLNLQIFWYFWIMYSAASENLMRICFSIIRSDRLRAGCSSLCAQNDRSSVPARRITVLLCKLQHVPSDVTAVVLCPFNGKVV